MPEQVHEQHWDPKRYARNARFVAELGAPLLALLDPKPHERILDLGCGDGALTEILAQRAGSVVAIDASAEQVAAARARGLEARTVDGQALRFESEFDAVFSNAALHWMRSPDVVIAGVWRVLRPGGRFVGEMGGAGNVDTIRTALIDALDRRGVPGADFDPWYFPDPEDYGARLARYGFVVEDIRLLPRPTTLPGDVSGWLETFAEPFLMAVPDGDRPNLIAELRDTLTPSLRDVSGRWTADYIRLRFVARKPA